MGYSTPKQYDARFRHLSEVNLIGLYILFVLATEDKQVAIIGNGFFKKYFKVSRVFGVRLERFGKNLSHLFKYKVTTDYQNRNRLELSLNGEFDKDRRDFNTIPNVLEIESQLGIQIYRVSVDQE